MNHVSRHDAITLHQDVKKEDFEKFMKEELMPLFGRVYKGPTRSSKADLQSQSLLRDTKGRKYIWTTVWEGSLESVRGSSFENTRMSKLDGMREADTMLKKLDTFGKRAAEKVFSEVHHADVNRNT